MSHIAILLPKDDLVLQARELAKGHYSIAEIRQIETENAVERPAPPFRTGRES